MNWFKRAIQRYDDWCKEMGLTPDQKRSCVPYRKDPAHQNEKQSTAAQSVESDKKPQDETF
jgi:hypothetical protein